MKKTVAELAKALGATLEGDGSIELTGVAAPERASSTDLIFVDAAKHAARAAASGARCMVAPEGISLAGKTVLRAKDAKVAFARAAGLLREPPVIANGVHATAGIAPLAKISPTAGIGPYAVIREDAHIRRRTPN